MLLGADNLAVESFPSSNPENFVPVHTYLLVERGVSIMEALWLEDLSKDQVYEFLFIASPLKFRGGTASPIRPLAISIQRKLARALANNATQCSKHHQEAGIGSQPIEGAIHHACNSKTA